jgi:amino acid transporter
MIAMLGVLVLYIFVFWIVMMMGIVNRFGYELVNAWGYLFYNAPGSAPLGGIAPIPTLYGLIGRPDLWPLWMVLTIGMLLITFALMPAYLVLASRIGLAWSMDRIVPAWFSKVNERTHSPLRVYFIVLIGGWVFDIATVYGLNPLTLAWYSTLLCAFTWIFPGFNALLMPFRRKDLYESSPWKKKIFSLPVVSLIGLIWLIFIIPMFTFSYFEPIISQLVQSLPAGQLWSYTASSGLTLVAIITGVGVVLYAFSYLYNKSHGVDIHLIFKQIPPE